MDDLQRALSDALLGLPSSATYSVQISDATTGAVMAGANPNDVLSTASVGKVLVLLELAERACAGEISLDAPVPRSLTQPVGDSGLWQHLAVDSLTLADVAALVGAASDNLGANVLIEVLGLHRIQAGAVARGIDGVELHDIVRGVRQSDHPPRLSSGSAAGLVEFLVGLHGSRELDGEGSPAARVLRWMALNVDLSMIASAFGLDPLAHRDDSRGIELASKTGTDLGVRADIGLVENDKSLAYAAIINWPEPPDHPADTSRDAVLAVMREIGLLIRTCLRRADAQP